MYRPPAFAVDEPDELYDMIESAAFGHLVTQDDDGRGCGFTSTALPLLCDRDGGTAGRLRGHFARVNDHWRHLDGAAVLVIFQLADGYVSPSWYPSKLDHGKVVPTWNYEVVHVHGTVRVHDDVEWVRQLVTNLTDAHEAANSSQLTAPPWAVSDAPPEFIERQLRAIVGIEVTITRIEGKRKLSQNRSAADRDGVRAGLAVSSNPRSQELAAAMTTQLRDEVS